MALTGNPWIDILLTFAILAIVFVIIVELVKYAGFVIPRIFYVVGGGIIAILLLVWIVKLLSSGVSVTP